MTSATGTKGFTLIEVMLAVVVLSFGAAGVIGAYMTSVNALEASRYTMEAAHLLKEKMSDIEKAAIENKGVSEGAETGRFTGIYRDFEWRSDIAFANLYLVISKDGEGEEELREYLDTVSVSVSNEKVKPPRRINVVTYMERKSELEDER